jgi:coenzyme F420-0:L-glutamate ligase/coenzyme F420-1:gamma-L-glutamate ligase
MENIQVMGVRGLPLIHAGDDIAALICGKVKFEDGDILSIASTIYSKAKGYTKKLADITASERAVRLGTLNGEDPRFVQVVLDASRDIIMEHPFILSEMASGHIGVRAGVDQSNIEDGLVIFLPPDPMKAAEGLREDIKKIAKKNVGVIITDSCKPAPADRVTGLAAHSGAARPVTRSAGAGLQLSVTSGATPTFSGMS